MEDDGIVALYFAQNEQALEETEKNTARIATPSLIKFSAAMRMRRSVSTTPTFGLGMPCRPSVPPICGRFS